MKKLITVFLIVILLLNLIFGNFYCVHAEETVPEGTGSPQKVLEVFEEIKEQDGFTNIIEKLEEGKVSVTNDNGDIFDVSTYGTTFSGSGTFSILMHVLGFIPRIANNVLTSAVNMIGDEDIKCFTIYDTVMGNYEMFNINYQNVPEEPTDSTSPYDIVKYNVIKYYKIFRYLSISISLFVLIYIGIRMAISTVATDKAKYKNMLLHWVASLMLLAVMHIIIISMSYILDLGLTIVNNLANAMNIKNIEVDILNKLLKDFNKVKGFNLFTSFIALSILVYYQIKFFVAYMHRLVEIHFLVVISPLITISYSIDKAGDGKAQAFQTWLGELTAKASIQVLHAVVYCVFIASVSVIAQNHPLLAVIFLGTLARTEKIVRKLFAISDDNFEKAGVPLVD